MGKGECDAVGVALFVGATAVGVIVAVANKAMYQLEVVGRTGELESFTPPLFGTLVMFLGMALALPLHWWETRGSQAQSLDCKTIALLSIPTMFDLVSTSLATLSVILLPLSTCILLRSSAVIFVALLKHYVLKDLLSRSEAVGVFIITLAIILVGYVGVSEDGGTRQDGIDDSMPSEVEGQNSGGAMLGVVFAMGSVLVAALQYVVEEKLLDDLSTPPNLLVGVMGAVGVALTLFVTYPVYYFFIPGSDHGRFEDPVNTLVKLQNSGAACALSAIDLFSVLLLNVLTMYIMQRLSAVWGAILGNIRPSVTWLAQLGLYYGVTNGAFGESWKGFESWLQLVGMVILFVGMAVYNGTFEGPAPDAAGPAAYKQSSTVRLSSRKTGSASSLSNPLLG